MTRLRQLLPYAVGLALLLVLRQSGLSERLNLLLYDLALQLRPTPSGASTPVRLIGIDENDLRTYGPLVADGLLAEAIERLDRIGVKAIGLDLFCGQPVGAGSARLRQLAANNPRLVSAYFDLDGKQAIPGTPPERQGYADLFTDPQDGVVRRDLLHVSASGQTAGASLPMRLLQVARADDRLQHRLNQHPQTLLRLQPGSGGYRPESEVSDEAHLLQMLPYHQPGSFPGWSLGSLLRNELSRAAINQLRGSIILIGVVAPSSKDQFAVPFSPWRQSERQFLLPGVEIHAHRLAGLLALAAGRQLGIQAAPPLLNGLLLLLAIGAGVMAGEAIPGLRRSQLVVAATLILAMGATAALLALGVWLDATLPLAAFGLMAAAAWIRRGGVEEIRGRQLEGERLHVRNLFDRYVSKQVADALLDNCQAEKRSGELREVSVLMSDLRGFSVLSQQHDPASMMQLLNNYLTAMFNVIESHGGTIDEVVGDAVLVIFGAPHWRRDHATAAVCCALAMQSAMTAVNQNNGEAGLPRLDMGIGICTGEVLAGTIGSRVRAKYSVVGAAVNLAARIEALTMGGEVFAAESTREAVTAPLRIDATYSVAPMGSSKPLQVYSIGAIREPYNIALAEPSNLCYPLDAPLDVHYSIMNGKQREGMRWPATICQVGSRQAWLIPREPNLQLFDNLILQIAGISGDTYAKVREAQDGRFRVVLSVMPDDLRDLLHAAVP